MSEAAAEHGNPRGIPQPACAIGPLREALVQLCPQALSQFDREVTVAKARARDLLSPAPMRQVLGQWAERVAAGDLGIARRMEDLARQAEATDEAETALALAAELSALQRAARDEAASA